MANYKWGNDSKSKTAHAFKMGGRLGMSESEYQRSYKMRSACGVGFVDYKKFIEFKGKKGCGTCERVVN